MFIGLSLTVINIIICGGIVIKGMVKTFHKYWKKRRRRQRDTDTDSDDS